MERAVMSAALPLLAAQQARVAVDDVIAIDRLTAATHGDRVLCAGDTEALFAVLTGVPLSIRRGAAPPLAFRDRGDDEGAPGEARVVAGQLSIAGHDVAAGAHRAVSGAAPLDPPLPLAWTAETYVAWGARLAGASARAARDLAPAALTCVGLAAARKRALQTLSVPERRALVLAQAVVMLPSVLIAEDPVSGLDGDAAGFVLAALAGASRDRSVVLSTAQLEPDGPRGVLVREATHVLVLTGGELAFTGSLAELVDGSRLYALTVQGNADLLRDELAARGIALRGGPLRFSAALPDGATTRDIVLAATRCRAPIVALIPLW